jgi:hypothetical protein
MRISTSIVRRQIGAPDVEDVLAEMAKAGVKISVHQ